MSPLSSDEMVQLVESNCDLMNTWLHRVPLWQHELTQSDQETLMYTNYINLITLRIAYRLGFESYHKLQSATHSFIPAIRFRGKIDVPYIRIMCIKTTYFKIFSTNICSFACLAANFSRDYKQLTFTISAQ